MAETAKILGQVNPSATTLTPVYTTPAGVRAVASTLFVCNQGTPGSFRVSTSIAGEGDAVKQYLFYDVPVGANTTVPITVGLTLGPADVVRVYASTANFSFNLFGIEIT